MSATSIDFAQTESAIRVLRNRAGEFGAIAVRVRDLLRACGEIWIGGAADVFFNGQEQGFIELLECERLTLAVADFMQTTLDAFKETERQAIAKLGER